MELLIKAQTMRVIEIADLEECIKLTIQEQERFNSALKKAEKNKLPGSKVVSIPCTEYVYTGAVSCEKTTKGKPKIDNDKLKQQLAKLGWRFEEFFAGSDDVGRICLVTKGEESVDLLVLGW
jgi:hypothetical protein